MNTFKQGRQIFLWADVDNDVTKKRIKNKKWLKGVKIFCDEPKKIRLTQSSQCVIPYRNYFTYPFSEEYILFLKLFKSSSCSRLKEIFFGSKIGV